MSTEQNEGESLVSRLLTGIFWTVIVFGAFAMWNRCGGDDTEEVSSNQESSAEVHFLNPDQVFDSGATLFNDPWCTIESNEIDCLGLRGTQNDFGDISSSQAEGWVLFQGFVLKFAENNKEFASLSKSYQYRANRCRSNPNREASIKLELSRLPMYAMTDLFGKEWARDVKSGTAFDVVMFEPFFDHKSPTHACDGTRTTVKTYSEGKYFIRPAINR